MASSPPDTLNRVEGRLEKARRLRRLDGTIVAVDYTLIPKGQVGPIVNRFLGERVSISGVIELNAGRTVIIADEIQPLEAGR